MPASIVDSDRRFHFRPQDEYKPGDILITREQMLERIDELAPQIAAKYKDKGLIFE